MTFLLAPLALLYRIALAVDRALKNLRREKLPRPVISIGNISVGGTGKTPLVIKLLTDLKKRGLRPAVLMRGYAAEAGFSDEAALLMKHHPDVPICVGADRVQSAHDVLARQKIDVFVLDDGFQHWVLDRNIDIVCVDGTDPWAGGHLLPQGRLREPKSALGRADLVVVTRCELLNETQKRRLFSEIERFVNSEKIIASSFKTSIVNWKTGSTTSLSDFNGRTVVALSGIGRPQSFEAFLKKNGADIRPLRFRDHHYYTEADLVSIEKKAKANSADVATTEKDLVKLDRTRWGKTRDLGFQVYAVAVKHEFSVADEDKWDDTLKNVKANPISA